MTATQSPTKSSTGGKNSGIKSKLWKGDEDLLLTLRFRLDQLEYTEYLAPESVDLVQRLLVDLITTTETAKSFKNSLEAAENEREMLSQQILPLKQEVASITRENNQLHMDVIKLTDERDKNLRNTETRIRQLESQNTELKFLNNQYALNLETEKRRAEQATQKAEELFGRISMAQQGKTTADKAEKIFQRLQKIDIETGLEPLDRSPVFFTPPDPIMCDTVQICQERIGNLEKQILKSQSRDSENEKDLAKREREISRLQNQLEMYRIDQMGRRDVGGDGQASSKALIAHDLESARERINQLETQIEYLQEHIESLEKELAQMEREQGTVHQAILSDKDDMARQLAIEQGRVKDLMDTLGKLETMIEELNALKNGPKAVFSREKLGNTVTKHVKKISELNESLKSTELKLETTQKRLVMSQKEVTKLKNELKAKDKEIAEKIKNVQDKAPILDSSAQKKKDELIQQLQKERDSLQLVVENHKKESSHTENSDAYELKSKISQLELQIQSLKLQVSLETNQRKEIANSLDHVQRERDELLNALELFEQQLQNVQTQIITITSERDNALKLYEQLLEQKRMVTPEIDVKDALVQTDAGKKNEKTPVDQTLVIENEHLKQKVSSLVEEIEKLQKDIESMVKRQRETGSLANEALTQLEHEIQEIKGVLEETMDKKQALETELETVKSTLAKESELLESFQLKFENQKIRISNYELELDEIRLKNREWNSKYSILELERDKLLSKESDLKSKLEERERQLGEQRELLELFDHERDGIQNELDEKTEKLIELDDIILLLKKSQREAEEQVIDYKQQIENITMHLNNKDKENANLILQLDESKRLVNQFKNSSIKFQEAAANLESDVKVLTKENQVLNSETSKVANVRDQYKQELRECERQLHYLDQLIRHKDEEAQQLMISYRDLIASHEKLEIDQATSQEELKNARMELIMRDKTIKNLQHEIDTHLQSLKSMKIDLNAYEKQCANLTRSLATSDRNQKHLEQDKQRLLRDIAAARDLAHGIDREKDGAQKHLIAITVENEQMSKHIEKLHADLQASVAQYQAEKLKVERLEHLVQMERTKNMKTDISNQEVAQSLNTREIQLQNLVTEQKSRMEQLENEVSQKQKELDSYRERVNRLEKIAADQHASIEQSQSESNQLKTRLKTLEQEVQAKTQLIQELISKNEPVTSLDQRIIDELQDTKRQVDKTRREISSLDDSVQCQIGSGEQDQRILETLAQIKDI